MGAKDTKFLLLYFLTVVTLKPNHYLISCLFSSSTNIFAEVAADVLYHKMVKLVYAATPNPTEDVARDFYFQQEKEKVMEFVKNDAELTKYIQRYVDMKEVLAFTLYSYL